MNSQRLPDFVLQPVFLLLIVIIPNVILILINIHSAWLAGPETRYYWIMLLGYAGLWTCLSVILLGLRKAQSRHISVRESVVMMAGHVMYLFVFMQIDQALIPAGMQPWVLDSGAVLMAQWTFMMPGIFYGVFRLSCCEHKNINMPVPAIILSLIFLLPVVFMFMLIIVKAQEFIGYFIFMAMALTFLYLFLRCVFLVQSTFFKDRSWENRFVNFCLAVSGPAIISLLDKVLGLFLPEESVFLYLVVGLNGVILMMPTLSRKGWAGFGLFIRCLTYPVSFYFFVITLPFLLISVFFIILLGAGLLMWIPTAIFVFHTRMLMRDIVIGVPLLGRAQVSVWVICGVLVLPLYLGVQCVRDKIVLQQALDYVYALDITNDARFAGDAKGTARTLQALMKFKKGSGFAYVSDIYNAVVFDGLVLSDQKIQHMYRLFAGKKMPDIRGINSDRSSDSGDVSWGAIRTENRDVVIVQETMDSKELSGQLRQSTLSLFLAWPEEKEEADKAAHRRWGGPREFFQTIDVPPGVLISGFRLKVADTLVPGRIIEKKTALWVYDQIKNTRRDPGLLVYQTPERLTLQVFPVQENETRQVEIDFLYPEGFHPFIRLNNRLVALNHHNGVASEEVVWGAHVLALPQKVIADLPGLNRKPYAHFIIDRSMASDLAADELMMHIQNVLKKYPDVERLRISAANYETQRVTPSFIKTNDGLAVQKALEQINVPLQGSLDLSRVMQGALNDYRKECLEDIKTGCWQEYPQFIVVTKNPAEMMPLADHRDIFKRDIPDVSDFWVFVPGQEIVQRPLWAVPPVSAGSEVIVLKQGPSAAVVLKSASGYMGGHEADPIEVWTAAENQFKPVAGWHYYEESGIYEKGLGLLLANEKAALSVKTMDQDKKRLVAESRQLGVLIPATAYMVVEEDSHWRGLADKEKKTMAGSDAFDLGEPLPDNQGRMDSPAPSWLILVLALILWESFKRRRLGRKEV